MNKAILLEWTIDEDTKSVSKRIRGLTPPKLEKNNLNFFYNEIGCEMIDVVRFDGFDIFVDDEGLLKKGNVVAEITWGEFKVPLAGNLLITKGADDNGKTLWFDNDELVDLTLMEKIVDMLDGCEFKGVTNG